jgi:hypothetical protein
MAVSGTYKLVLNSPRGQQTPTLTLKEDGGSVSGTFAGRMGEQEFSGGTAEGNDVKFDININAMGKSITLNAAATIDGDSISGTMTTSMGGMDFTGQREG